MRIQINPSERISITNDPYSEELLRRNSMPDSDGFASDEDGDDDDDVNNDSDTDSIKQLEWDCLESSLDAILSDDEAINSLLNVKQQASYDAQQDTDNTTIDSDESTPCESDMCVEFKPMLSSENLSAKCDMETRL